MQPQTAQHSQDKFFLMVVLVLMVITGVVFDNPHVAMWFGFIMAGYSVVANDSIQTIGTFLASNKHRKWWVLWIYIGGIFLATHLYGWATHGGDVSYGRLAAKGLEETPQDFDYLQIAAPIFLLILTHLRMPVSTTFLILSSFAKKASTIAKIASKSLMGYLISFVVSLIAWPVIKKLLNKYGSEKPHKAWALAQWIISGLLWAVWLMQDAANVAVFLPRSLSVFQVSAFSIIMLGTLGILMKLRGGRIQSVVESKTLVGDMRHATIIDGIYASILYYFKVRSKLPMSTTWVFLGNLGGRELGLSLIGEGNKPKKVKNAILRDIGYATIGLVVSLFIAAGVNEHFKAMFVPW